MVPSRFIGHQKNFSRSPSRQLGMTLVELLIVIAIIGLLGSLMAPAATKALDRARAQEEFIVLDRTVRSLALRAFMEGREVTIEGRGASLIWTVGAEPPTDMQLTHLFFDPAQRVAINSSGYADANVLGVLHAGRRREIELNGWVDER